MPRSSGSGIFLSPRTCGRILALNRKLYGLPKPAPVPREPKPMPFAAARRHQYWSADIRYVDHGLGDFKVYSITMLDNYSRAIVASGLSRTPGPRHVPDGALHAAIRQHGAPEAMVTTAAASSAPSSCSPYLDRLGVQQARDRRGASRGRTTSRPTSACSGGWPTGTSLRRRPGPNSWPSTTTGSPSYNYQDHWAHRERPEDRRSPAAVLAPGVREALRPEELHRIFYSTRFGRCCSTTTTTTTTVHGGGGGGASGGGGGGGGGGKAAAAAASRRDVADCWNLLTLSPELGNHSW